MPWKIKISRCNYYKLKSAWFHSMYGAFNLISIHSQPSLLTAYARCSGYRTFSEMLSGGPENNYMTPWPKKYSLMRGPKSSSSSWVWGIYKKAGEGNIWRDAEQPNIYLTMWYAILQTDTCNSSYFSIKQKGQHSDGEATYYVDFSVLFHLVRYNSCN